MGGHQLEDSVFQMTGHLDKIGKAYPDSKPTLEQIMRGFTAQMTSMRRFQLTGIRSASTTALGLTETPANGVELFYRIFMNIAAIMQQKPDGTPLPGISIQTIEEALVVTGHHSTPLPTPAPATAQRPPATPPRAAQHPAAQHPVSASTPPGSPGARERFPRARHPNCLARNCRQQHCFKCGATDHTSSACKRECECGRSPPHYGVLATCPYPGGGRYDPRLATTPCPLCLQKGKTHMGHDADHCTLNREALMSGRLDAPPVHID
jgi:hypothetical protein